MASVATDRERHPRGLYVLFFTEMWERFGFYSMLAMFTLYLKGDPTPATGPAGLGWTAERATHLYANYLMFVYASPLIGGWLADIRLGYRNSVLLGGLIFMVGYFLLTFRSESMVYAALACLVVGNGFFKPNVSAMVGQLYPERSALKDRAYNIFYMGINIGALLAPINAEIMVHRIGFNLAFGMAALGMIVSVLILWGFRRHVEPAPRPALGTPGAAASTNPIDAVPDYLRVSALIVIFTIVIVFWMVFHQNGSTLTYWADDNTRWQVSGIISNAINPFWVVTLTFPLIGVWGWLSRRGLEPSTPTKMALGMFLTAASFFLLHFAATTGEGARVDPAEYASMDYRVTERALNQLQEDGLPADVLSKLQGKDEQGKFIVMGRKFATDQASSGEAKLRTALDKVLGPEEASRHQVAIQARSYLFKVSPLWLIIAYGIVTLGELMLSPMGLSLVSKVAPIRMRGLMMGGWFVATAIGNKLTAIGVYWDVWRQSTFFAVLGGMALVTAVILLLLLKPLKKAMPGV